MFQSRLRAVSEVVGTMLTAAMTIIAAAAIFGYVNGQAGNSAQAYGTQVGSSVQYLEEKFTVVDMAWTSSTSVTLWIYNTGKIQLNLLQVRFYDSAGLVNILFNYSKISGSNTNRVHDFRSSSSGKCGISGTSYENPVIVGSGSFVAGISNAATIQLTIPPSSSGCPSYGQTLVTGTTYFVAVSGTNGNSYTFSQVR